MPYSPSQDIVRAAQQGIPDMNRYCDLKDLELFKDLLADYTGVPKRHIILYPGTDLLLREIVHIFSNRKMIMVKPSFWPTVLCAEQFASRLVQIPLEDPDFNLDSNKLLNELTEPCILIIDNPNNPTGKIILDKDIVMTILRNEDVLLVVDEAYFEFTEITFASMVEEFPNLAVTRTISKAFGLAGARIGYLVAGETFLEAFSTFFTFLPQPCLFAAVEAIKNPNYANEYMDKTVRERERVKKRLEAMGLHVFPSCTNFLLIKTPSPDMANKLMERGIRIFDPTTYWRAGFIRVSIGTLEENELLLETLAEIINGHKFA